MDIKNIKLLESTAHQRMLRDKAYLLELDIDKLLLHHEFEAGIQTQFHEREVESFGGWDNPLSHIRGTMTGHYLSAAASIAQETGCIELETRVRIIINRLIACEQVNGDNWFFPIPQKYLTTLATSSKFWAPQYVCQKNIMGLLEAYLYLEIDEALILIEKATCWFTDFVNKLSRAEMDKAMESQETGAFLQTWLQIYKVTKDQRHLDLAYAYMRPLLTEPIFRGEDILSDNHANITIPEIHGVAELYDVTNESKYLRIVENYWKMAIEQKGTYVTGGSTSGEHWTRDNQLYSRLSTTNQEHCTVYNMIWLADYLYKITRDVKYQDYIELNIYNGIYAQSFYKPLVHDCQCTDKNPDILPVAYYLPMIANGQKKWGSKFDDFWCCHCTAMQANAKLRELIYFKQKNKIYINQYIESEFKNDSLDLKIQLCDDQQLEYIGYKIEIRDTARNEYLLRLPNWASGYELESINGEAINTVVENGYIKLAEETDVKIKLYRRLERDYIDDSETMFGIRFGPVALAAIESQLVQLDSRPIDQQLIYQSSRVASDWNVRFITKQAVELLPIYMVGEERYTLYFKGDDD